MKLAHLVTRLQRRGAEVFACQLCDELVRRGHYVTLTGLYAGTPGALVPRHATAVDLGGHRRPGVDPALVRRLADQLAADPPDLVQANGSDTLKYASAVKRRLDAEWPLVYRNIGIPSTWAKSVRQRLGVRWMLRRVDRIASVSAASARDFARTYRMDPARIVTIPRGIECPDLAPREARRARLAEEAGIDGEGAILVHVGSFTEEKNHRGLIEAFARILRECPDGQLVLIGEGPLEADARSAAAEAGVADRVRMLGSRPDAAELAGGGDVFLLPSLTEGLPGVVLEAAAREVPTVAFDVGGVSEAIEDGRTGYVVPSGDLAGLSRRALALLADPELARSMGRAARDHVCGLFGLPRVVDAFEDLYQSLVPCPVDTESSI